MIGIAKGMNATSSTFSVGLLATMDAPEEEGGKQLKAYAHQDNAAHNAHHA
jgi:hypothetical protein